MISSRVPAGYNLEPPYWSRFITLYHLNFTFLNLSLVFLKLVLPCLTSVLPCHCLATACLYRQIPPAKPCQTLRNLTSTLALTCFSVTEPSHHRHLLFYHSSHKNPWWIMPDFAVNCRLLKPWKWEGPLTNQSTCSDKYVVLRMINNIKRREQVHNFKKSGILCQFTSVTSGTQVRVLVLSAHTF